MKILFLLFFCFSFIPPLISDEGVVTANALNVRIAPDSSSTPVDLLKKENRVRILSAENPDWYEIELPRTASVWVAKNFLNSNGTLKQQVRLRSGPSALYEIYRTPPQLFPGAVQIRKKSADSHWLLIVPPSGLRGYVMKMFVRNLTPPSSAPSASGAAKDDGETLSYIDGDERPVNVEGILTARKKPYRNATHELLIETNGRRHAVCYLTSSHLNISLWEGRLVRIDGVQRWIRGCSLPIIEIEKVSPSWR